jgi:hypothetical protein
MAGRILVVLAACICAAPADAFLVPASAVPSRMHMRSPAVGARLQRAWTNPCARARAHGESEREEARGAWHMAASAAHLPFLLRNYPCALCVSAPDGTRRGHCRADAHARPSSPLEIKAVAADVTIESVAPADIDGFRQTAAFFVTAKFSNVL